MAQQKTCVPSLKLEAPSDAQYRKALKMKLQSVGEKFTATLQRPVTYATILDTVLDSWLGTSSGHLSHSVIGHTTTEQRRLWPAYLYGSKVIGGKTPRGDSIRCSYLSSRPDSKCCQHPLPWPCGSMQTEVSEEVTYLFLVICIIPA